jgi:5-methyltetrahydrofolate--homocysteine methyltransferase
MAKDAARKLAVAARMRDLLVDRHGMLEADIVFDPLTFTIAQGEEDSRKLGLETLEGIRLIEASHPGRSHDPRPLQHLLRPQALPAPDPQLVYLAEAREHGLDGAILNAKKIIPTHKLARTTSRSPATSSTTAAAPTTTPSSPSSSALPAPRRSSSNADEA